MIFCRLMMLINFVGCSNFKSVRSLTLADEVLGKFLKYAVEPIDFLSKHKIRVYVVKAIRLIRKHEEVKIKLDRLETARLCLNLMARMKNADDAMKIAKTKGMLKEDKADVKVENAEIQEKYEGFKKGI